VRDLNRKILVIAVALMTIAMIVAPAMAAPATKIEGVTLTRIGSPVTSSYRFVAHDTIRFSEGTTDGTVALTIPNIGDLNGNWHSEWHSQVRFSQPNPNLVPDLEADFQTSGVVVLTFTDVGATGTFEGMTHQEMIGYQPPFASYVSSHMVLHGTGDFRGQTLKIAQEGTPPADSVGCLIIPK
jgi:hypothetical protein